MFSQQLLKYIYAYQKDDFIPEEDNQNYSFKGGNKSEDFLFQQPKVVTVPVLID